MVFRRLDLEARRVRLCLLGQGKSVRGLLYEGGMPCVGDFEEEPDFAVQVVTPEFGGVEGVRPWWRPVDHVLLCDLEPAGRHQGLGITTAGVVLLEELVDVLHGVRRDVVAQDEDGVAYFDDSPVEMKVRVFQRQGTPPRGMRRVPGPRRAPCAPRPATGGEGGVGGASPRLVGSAARGRPEILPPR